MSRFITPLKTTQIDQGHWQLDAPLVYESDLLQQHVSVPAGFVTDFASVPRVPIAYMVAGGKANAAAVIHDWFYSTHAVTREQADDVFYEAVRALGHSVFTAYTMWLAVRAFGGFAWNKPNVPQAPHIEEVMDRAA